MGIVAIYQPEVVRALYFDKQEISQYYNKELPKMYREKMLKRGNLGVKFTQADIDRIWNAKL